MATPLQVQTPRRSCDCYSEVGAGKGPAGLADAPASLEAVNMGRALLVVIVMLIAPVATVQPASTVSPEVRRLAAGCVEELSAYGVASQAALDRLRQAIEEEASGFSPPLSPAETDALLRAWRQYLQWLNLDGHKGWRYLRMHEVVESIPPAARRGLQSYAVARRVSAADRARLQAQIREFCTRLAKEATLWWPEIPKDRITQAMERLASLLLLAVRQPWVPAPNRPLTQEQWEAMWRTVEALARGYAPARYAPYLGPDEIAHKLLDELTRDALHEFVAVANKLEPGEKMTVVIELGDFYSRWGVEALELP